ncbi:uncharacterized protein LOC103707757 [Phoenix dactylifera]|uniref:Uncharacterized protein LOC103707757 n=1 Tax=Phoenix dactylifera TaxID=42345 RepID=A0A8B7C377_PHODC|nr:uncharacterized protein LOC103707757 [Phoenix dactylifera]
MASDDFIDLDANNHESKDSDLHRVDFRLSETDCLASTPQMKEGVPSSTNIETLEANSREEDDQHVQDMDLEDDLVPFTSKKGDLVRNESTPESTSLVATAVTAEAVNEVEPDKENSCAVPLNDIKSNNLLIDESPLAGVKRARMEYVDEQPSVRVIYSSLTRESKRKLMVLMQYWSEWEAQCQSSSSVSPEEALECGEETYFPALHVGSKMSTTVSFWLDNQARKVDVKEMDSDLVPLYNREYTLGSTSVDGSTNPKGTQTLEASRCFNCGSYSHSLKECPKPRDNVAISNARKQHKSKRNPAAGTRGQSRYYQKAPGKFDDLRAGVLGAETRECLGIGEYDPPPWLHRMREMGYPPGYLDVIEDEDQPSGITIYADEEIQEDYEDGEIPEKGEPEPPERRMTVEFPGINAPIPENADYRRWATPSAGYSGSMSFKSHSHARSNRLSESHRGHYHDHRWSTDQRDDGPPGSKHGFPSPMAGYSPRYSPYDQNPIPRSPSQGRSISESGWWSPMPFESPPAQSPHSQHPYSAHQSAQYHSSRLEHSKQESTFGMSPDMSQGRDRHHHRHHSRR